MSQIKKVSNQINWMFIVSSDKWLRNILTQLEIKTNLLNTPLAVAMPDIKNFFHKVLAEVFAKVQYLYSRRKLLVSCIK